MSKDLSTSAYKLDTEVKRLKKNINSGFLELAKHLKQIRDEQLYKDLDYGTFESYIAQPELSFSRRNVFHIIAIYEKFVLELGVPQERIAETEWTKLREVMPYVDGKNTEEILTKVETLSRSDLKLELEGEEVAPGTHTEPELSVEPEIAKLELRTDLQRIIEDSEASGLKLNSKDYEFISYLEVQKIIKRLASFDPASDFLIFHVTKHGSSWNVSISGDKPIPTKQIRRPSCPNKIDGHQGCIKYIEDVQKQDKGHKFINFPKQIGALHKILKAGFTFEDMDEAIEKIKTNSFYQEKGWDFITVAQQLERGDVNA